MTIKESYYIIYGQIQGITEFIPVSSSAHINLLSKIFDHGDVELIINFSAHLGSLIAVIFFFREEMKKTNDSKNRCFTNTDCVEKKWYRSYDKVKRQPNIKISKGDVVDVLDQYDCVLVKTRNETFKAGKVLNSIPNDSYKTNLNFPVLLQHFVGWTIKTNKPVFDEDKATLMDFSIDQKNETRFFYVLPTSKNEALVEFTLFSKELITNNEYDIEIKKHLQSLGIIDYEIKAFHTSNSFHHFLFLRNPK